MAASLYIAHINTRSLLPKIEEIRFLIKKTDLDILCISETRLSDKVSDNEVYIHGYTVKRQDRLDGRRGGGVCMYVKNTLPLLIGVT